MTTNSPTPYDKRFYEYTCCKSSYAASRIVSLLISLFNPKSVCDVGCGEGVWLSTYQTQGVKNVHGLDGSYVDKNRLRINEKDFTACDLAQPFCIKGRFDIIQSLEVAEHLPLSQSKHFIENLTRASDVVVFSASTPGQGGVSHINEQPLDYWRAIFISHGFVAYDIVRPHIIHDKKIPPWYRYNTLVYVSEKARAETLSAIQSFKIPEATPVPILSPLWYRLRCLAIRSLPFSIQQLLAKLVS